MMFARVQYAARFPVSLKMYRHASFHWHPQTLQACSFHAVSRVTDTRSNTNKLANASRLTPLQQNAYLYGHPCCLQTRTFVNLAAFLGPDFPPIKCMQHVLETIHDTTGLPWWASVILSTFIMRTLVTFPLAVYAQYNGARVANLKMGIAETAQELKAEVDIAAQKYQWGERVARYQFHLNMKRLLKEAYIRENCHPAKSVMVVLTQIPLWVSFSLGLRNLAGALQIPGQELPVLRPDLGSEGALWFSNLLLPDPYLILPCAMCLSSLFLLEMSTWRPVAVSEPLMQKFFLNAMRVWSVMLLPIGAVVPSCISLYWCCSMLYGVGQNLFMRHPHVRQALWIPQTKQDTDTPYKDMWKFAKKKYVGTAERAQHGWEKLSSDPFTVLKDKTIGRVVRMKNLQQETAQDTARSAEKHFNDEEKRKSGNDKPS